MNENEMNFKCPFSDCELRFFKIEQLLNQLKENKLDSSTWQNDFQKIERKLYQFSTKFDNLSNTVSQHDDILSKMKDSIDYIKDEMLEIKENNANNYVNVTLELGKISDSLNMLKEKYIDRFEDIDRLIKIKVYECNKEKSEDKSTWQNTLLNKFNIGKKFSTFLKIVTGVLFSGLVISIFTILIFVIINAEDIMKLFAK